MFIVSAIMSTAKRLVLSLAGRKDSQHTSGASSTRLVGNSLSPGHELDEIAIVSHGGIETLGRVSYGSLSLNGPHYIPGKSHISHTLEPRTVSYHRFIKTEERKICIRGKKKAQHIR